MPAVAEVFAANVLGVVRVTRTFLPLFERSSNPVVVNSSGMGSFGARPIRTVWVHHRRPRLPRVEAAVTMLTTQYAKALRHIRIDAVDPGWTATDFKRPPRHTDRR